MKNKNKEISPKIAALVFGVLVLLFAIGFYTIGAWTPPGAAPPGANVPAPINVGPDPQIKAGPLQVSGFRNLGGTILDGNVGIGTTTPTGPLHVMNLLVFETNDEAIAGGLTVGAFYRTAAGVVGVRVPISPDLHVTPTTITDTLAHGAGWTTIGTVNVTNPGEGTLSWSETDDRAWLNATPDSGTTTTEIDTVTIQATTAGLGVGTHTGTITFTGAAPVTGSPDKVTVTLIVVEPPKYLLFDTALPFTGNVGGREGADHKCQVTVDRPAACMDGWAFMSFSVKDEIQDMDGHLGTKRIDPTLPWEFRDGAHAGVSAALNWSDLLDGTAWHQPFFGGLDANFWTFSTDGGLLHPNNCVGGTSWDPAFSGRAGNHLPDFIFPSWLSARDDLCFERTSLLCACRTYTGIGIGI